MADNMVADTGSHEAQSDDMVVMTNAARVSCNGGGGALGHPQIWLNMGADNSVTCPYCSRQFIKQDDA